MSLTISETNSRLASPDYYLSPDEVDKYAKLLHTLPIKAIFKVELNDGFYHLSPPSSGEGFYCYEFASGVISPAGMVVKSLRSQSRWLWNLPLIGVVWKLRREHSKLLSKILPLELI